MTPGVGLGDANHCPVCKEGDPCALEDRVLDTPEVVSVGTPESLGLPPSGPCS